MPRSSRLSTHGVTCFLCGVAAVLLSVLSGAGPCGPSTPLGHALISLGTLTVLAGMVLMISAVLRAAFGRRW